MEEVYPFRHKQIKKYYKKQGESIKWN
jgi:hypothetical protein